VLQIWNNTSQTRKFAHHNKIDGLQNKERERAREISRCRQGKNSMVLRGLYNALLCRQDNKLVIQLKLNSNEKI